MKQKTQQVTDAELAVLEVLWQQGAVTKRQIADSLYPGGADSDLATVQKLLERLENKGHIRRDRSATAHLFEAAVARTAFAGEQLAALAQKLSGGSIAPLLVHLVEAKRLSARDREKIRKLLDKDG